MDNGQLAGWAYVTSNFMGNKVHLINQIFVLPSKRGNGFANAILTEITTDADKERATLILSFSPEEFGSDSNKLQKLYESHDFRWDDSIGGMWRAAQ